MISAILASLGLDLAAAADRVAYLRALGYCCPAEVEQALREAED